MSGNEARKSQGKAQTSPADAVVAIDSAPTATTSVSVELESQSFREMVRSKALWLIVVIYALSQLRFNTYFGTASPQLAAFGATADTTRLFNILVPCGVLTTPAVGWLIDTYGNARMLLLVQLLLLIHTVIILIPVLALQYVGFLLFGICRVAFYTSAFTYLMRVFGFVHLGKLNGILTIIACGFGSLQYALLALALHQGDNFLIPNLLLLGLGFVGTLLAGATFSIPKARTTAKGDLKKELQQTQTRVSPRQEIELLEAGKMKPVTGTG